jgi:hypothetical protein
VTTGRDVPEAVLRALHLERLAFFTWQLHVAGDRVPRIDPEDEEFFTRPYKKSMGADTGVAVGKERGADTDWRWISYVAQDEVARRMEGEER